MLIPEDNRKDLVDVPDQAKNEMDFVFASRMDEVLKAALESDPFDRPATVQAPSGDGTQKPVVDVRA